LPNMTAPGLPVEMIGNEPTECASTLSQDKDLDRLEMSAVRKKLRICIFNKKKWLHGDADLDTSGKLAKAYTEACEEDIGEEEGKAFWLSKKAYVGKALGSLRNAVQKEVKESAFSKLVGVEIVDLF
jgi:hypothetical protein